MEILAPEPVTDLTSVAARALLDTGSTTSGVTSGIADQLRLPRLGKRPLGSAQGEAQAERFLFRVALRLPDAPLPFVFNEIMGFEVRDGFAFNALIGMDILGQCDFEMRRDGSCRLAFG